MLNLSIKARALLMLALVMAFAVAPAMAQGIGTPSFGTVDFSGIWVVVAALVSFLAVPLAIRYGIIVARKAVSAIGSALH